MIKKLHKKLETEIDEMVERGILPGYCRLNSRTLRDLAMEVPKRWRVVIPYNKRSELVVENSFAYGSKAGVVWFKVDNRLGYGNFKITDIRQCW